jgi:hypothetical protein
MEYVSDGQKNAETHLRIDVTKILITPPCVDSFYACTGGHIESVCIGFVTHALLVGDPLIRCRAFTTKTTKTVSSTYVRNNRHILRVFFSRFGGYLEKLRYSVIWARLGLF